MELSICQDLVHHLEGFVSPVKGKITTPKCAHKRIPASTSSPRARMPPSVNRSNWRNCLSEHSLAHEMLKIWLGFPIYLSAEHRLNLNSIQEPKPMYCHSVFTPNSRTYHRCWKQALFFRCLDTSR